MLLHLLENIQNNLIKLKNYKLLLINSLFNNLNNSKDLYIRLIIEKCIIYSNKVYKYHKFYYKSLKYYIDKYDIILIKYNNYYYINFTINNDKNEQFINNIYYDTYLKTICYYGNKYLIYKHFRNNHNLLIKDDICKYLILYKKTKLFIHCLNIDFYYCDIKTNLLVSLEYGNYTILNYLIKKIDIYKYDDNFDYLMGIYNYKYNYETRVFNKLILKLLDRCKFTYYPNGFKEMIKFAIQNNYHEMIGKILKSCQKNKKNPKKCSNKKNNVITFD